MSQALGFQAAIVQRYQQVLKRQRVSRARVEQLLDVEQRCALAKLAVFPSCFDVQAAAAVLSAACGRRSAARQRQPPAAAAPHLGQLQTKSAADLLWELQMRGQLSHDPEQRCYRVHPSARAIAAELWSQLPKAQQHAAISNAQHVRLQ